MLPRNTNVSILCMFQPFSKRRCIIEGPTFQKTGCARSCNITVKVQNYSSLRWNVHKGLSKCCLLHCELSFWGWETFGDVRVVSIPFYRGLRGATVNLGTKYRVHFCQYLSTTRNNSSPWCTLTPAPPVRFFSCHTLLTTLSYSNTGVSA